MWGGYAGGEGGRVGGFNEADGVGVVEANGGRPLAVLLDGGTEYRKHIESGGKRSEEERSGHVLGRLSGGW